MCVSSPSNGSQASEDAEGKSVSLTHCRRLVDVLSVFVAYLIFDEVLGEGLYGKSAEEPWGLL